MEYCERLEKAYTKGKRSYFWFLCKECGKKFIARSDNKPKSCGCLIEKQSLKYKAQQLNKDKNAPYEFIEIPKNQKDKVLVKCKQCGSVNKVLPQPIIDWEKLNRKGCENCKSISLQKISGGIRKHPAYNILDGIKQRCYNPNSESYKWYGARGIKICDEWLDKDNGYVNFCKCADENGFKEGLTIDRIDVNSNYEPNNCRWIPNSQQKENKRRQMNNKTGYRGIWFNKDINKYESAITIDNRKKTLGYFTIIEQAYLTREYYLLKNNIKLSSDLKQCDIDILKWNIERCLFEFNEENEINMFKEELKELEEGKINNDTHEIIDAYADIYVVFTQTLAKAGSEKINIDENSKLWKYYLIYKNIFDELRKMGYNPEKALNEVVKEITSRKQDSDQARRWLNGEKQEGEKWLKSLTQDSKTLYEADFEKAKIKGE